MSMVIGGIIVLSYWGLYIFCFDGGLWFVFFWCFCLIIYKS